MKHLVIIPTYNEIENIESIINAVLNVQEDIHILVVDDNSPDGTAAQVKRMQADQKERLHILERKGKLGLGTAYIAGFKYGIEKKYELIIEMDADFSHKPADVPRLIDACLNQSADVSVGSRYVKGGGTENWDWYRLFLSRGASFYTRIITFLPVKDATAGFVCYKRAVLESMDLSKIKFIGYAFQIEMKYYAHQLGFKIKEVPIIFADRELGTSKMNTSIVKEAILGVISMRLRNYKN